MITVILLLVGVGFVLHQKHVGSKSANEGRHAHAERAEIENARNTIAMESNPLAGVRARRESSESTDVPPQPAKERPRSRAPTHETWPAPAPAPAAADSTPAVFVNGAFETPPAAAADDASVNVQKYENYFPKVGAKGGAGVAGGGAGGGNSGNGGAHIYENHAPEHSNLSTVDVLPEIPTEYNSDYQIPDALIVEGSESSDYQSLESLIVGGFNLDYADLGKNNALYASSA